MNQTNIIESRGGPSRIAKVLGITVAAVSAWHGVIPPRRALQLGAITGRPVSELRPDIFRKDHPSNHIAAPVNSTIPDSSVCPQGHSE